MLLCLLDCTPMMLRWRQQEESSSTDNENSVVFDVSSQQNVWRDDSHSISSSSFTEVG